MTEFPGAECLAAAHEIAGSDDTAADTAAHGKVDEVFASSAGSEEPFRQSAAVGIVFKTPGNGKFLFEIVQYRNVAPQRIVGRFGHDPSCRISRERGGYTESVDICHFQTGFTDEPFCLICHPRQHLCGVGVAVVPAGGAEEFSGAVTESDTDFGTADIKA